MAISDKVIIYNSIGNPFPSYSEGIANDYIYGNNFHKLGIIGDKSQFTFLNSNEMTYNGFQYRSVSSGLNEYNFTTPSINDRWIGLYFNGYNNSWAIGQLKLIFSTGEKLSIMLKIKKATLSTYPLEVTFKPVQLRKAIYTEPELDTRQPDYPYRISYFTDENLNEYLIAHDSSSTPFSEDVALIYTETNKLKYVGTTNPSVITYKYYYNGAYIITGASPTINFDPDTFSANFDIYDVNGNLWYDATTTQFKPIRLRKAII